MFCRHTSASFTNRKQLEKVTRMYHQTAFNRCRFETRLARNTDELRAIQRLRYQVFYEEMGALATAAQQEARLDADHYDPLCDHLMVLDHDTTDENGRVRVAGAYRLGRRSQMPEGQNFYSEGEFSLGALKRHPGEILELGRSCVHPDYRNRAVLDMLWRGLGNYVTTYQVEIMFGCASFPGTDPDEIAPALTYLHENHLAPECLRPQALPGQYVQMRRGGRNSIGRRDALRQMPPLIRGYLSAGCFVGDGAVIDRDFNTVDVCVMVITQQLGKSYKRRYQEAG
jgi:L-ornithine Nalpha-acyltransferase